MAIYFSEEYLELNCYAKLYYTENSRSTFSNVTHCIKLRRNTVLKSRKMTTDALKSDDKRGITHKFFKTCILHIREAFYLQKLGDKKIKHISLSRMNIDTACSKLR